MHRAVAEVQKLYVIKTTYGSDQRDYGIIVKLVAAECANRCEAANARCVD